MTLQKLVNSITTNVTTTLRNLFQIFPNFRPFSSVEQYTLFSFYLPLVCPHFGYKLCNHCIQPDRNKHAYLMMLLQNISSLVYLICMGSIVSFLHFKKNFVSRATSAIIWNSRIWMSPPPCCFCYQRNLCYP